jgi:lipopolysaccharide export system protein LptA
VQKLRLFFILFLSSFSLLAQQKTKIELLNAVRGTASTTTDAIYFYKPTFKHDNAILSADSAVLYTVKNYFEAFNNVHINQADTVNIYSTLLTYDGNAKLAHLSENVKLVDNTSVLTTNILDYNMASKIGTYIQGGKLVSKDVTLTSKNGYYFANSKDAYFRYNVVAVTPSATIKSDTLRYNTLSNWSYFYGPTNIKGKDDNLYTENGAYNTKSEYAYFGKKNLYTQGSKSLKGDSLYYNGKDGYGKAVRNIVFKDTEDNVVMYGQLGEYFKEPQRTVITRNAYVGYGTTDSIMINNKKVPDSLWLGADTLETEMVLQHTLKLIGTPVVRSNAELGEEDKTKAGKGALPNPDAPVKKPAAPAESKPVTPKPTEKLSKKEARRAKKSGKDEPPLLATDSLKVKADSLGLDSLARLGTDSLKIPDSLKTPAALKLKSLTDSAKLKRIKDTSKLAAAAKAGIGLPKTKDALAKGKDSLLKAVKPFNPADTVRARIIQAYHNVKVYKSNMQAKADSLFYTSADSTFRWFRNPILWAEGSQQTGDTIYLQLKNKKMNSVQVIQNGFIVNVDTDSNKVAIDSTKFNQVKGKLITGFFEDGSIKTLYVDGNAESIYFFKNDKNVFEKMNQTVSGRIKILFKEKDITNVINIKSVEAVMYPIEEVAKEPVLTGFIWKPELRPGSKKDVISGRAIPKATKKRATPAKTPAGKTPAAAKSNVEGAKGLVKDALNKQKIDIDAISKMKVDTTGMKIDTSQVKKEIEKAAPLIKKLQPDSVIKKLPADSVIKKLQPAPSKN